MCVQAVGRNKPLTHLHCYLHQLVSGIGRLAAWVGGVAPRRLPSDCEAVLRVADRICDLFDGLIHSHCIFRCKCERKIGLA